MYTPELLHTIYENLLLEAQGEGQNAYDYSICSLQNNATRVVDRGGEKHHILPKHAGGTDDQSNLIFLTPTEHLIAHWVRWEVFGDINDQSACAFRFGDPEAISQARSALVKAARQRDKENGTGFHNSAFQRELGLRGGKKGGLANTAPQFQARQQVGLTYGRSTGMKNQGEGLKQQLTYVTLWVNPAIHAAENKDLYYVIGPKKAAIDLVRSLKQLCPNHGIRNAEPLYKVLRGDNPQMYGWSKVKRFTSSEFAEGINQFKRNHRGNPPRMVTPC